MSTAPLSVLIVDDSEADARLAENLLRANVSMQFNVVVEARFDGFYTRLLDRRENYDAILLSARPNSGNEVRELKHLTSALGPQPLIVCHEFYDPHLTRALATSGVQAILPKSAWSVEALSHTVMFALSQLKRIRSFGHDELTGLATRSIWLDRLDHALDRCRRNQSTFALMMIDADDFKRVNDTLGHEAGDRMLRIIAQRMVGALRQNDTVARLGGDEFAVLIEDLPYPEAAIRVARTLLQEVCSNAVIGRSEIPVSISIGIAILHPEKRELTREWAQTAADAALYAAKRAGKGRFSVYTDDLDRSVRDKLMLDDEMARAVQRNELSVHYQPIVDINDGQLRGFEALLRWTGGPRQGVSPSVFVPVLEQLGLMDRVGSMVMRESLTHIADWRRTTGHDLSVHVNLSAAQVVDSHFADEILATLHALGLPGRALVIELTESTLFKHTEQVANVFGRLRRQGVSVAIDDFGTGYNSLVYLKNFHPDVVKIDRAFVSNIVESSTDVAIVRALSTLSRELGILLIAEGVESQTQLDALRRLGAADQVQGYFTGHPMPADHVRQSLAHFPQRINGFSTPVAGEQRLSS